MIGFFPELYSDELLYSACARYVKRVKYPNKHMVIRDLFGKRGLSAVVDFPTRLEFLLSSIPNHEYSADGIINQNTLFPFYEPFIIVERAKMIREEMRSLTENHLQTRLATNIQYRKLFKRLWVKLNQQFIRNKKETTVFCCLFFRIGSIPGFEQKNFENSVTKFIP